MISRLKNWISGFRWKLITSTSKYPNSDLHACFSNIRRRGFRPNSVMDIGANRGRWSEPCRKVFPDAQFTLFEPQSEMRRPLDAFCQRSPKSKWFQMGLADRPGKLPFIVYEDQVSSSFDFEPENNYRNCEVREIEVATVNQLIKDKICPVPDILKIDAEGFEARILDGADSVFGITELIFLEVQLFNDQSDCSFLNLANRMDSAGYSIYDFSWFGRRHKDKAIALSEVVFAKKDGILRADPLVRFTEDYSKLRKKIA